MENKKMTDVKMLKDYAEITEKALIGFLPKTKHRTIYAKR